jgi:hypothetical protein
VIADVEKSLVEASLPQLRGDRAASGRVFAPQAADVDDRQARGGNAGGFE